MAEPFLNLGNIRAVFESIGGGRRPHRMHTQPVDLNVEAGCLPILPDHVPIEGIRIERPLELGRCGCCAPGGTAGRRGRRCGRP